MEGFNKISTIIALTFGFIFVVVMITFASTTNRAINSIGDSIEETSTTIETTSDNSSIVFNNDTTKVTLTANDANKLTVTIYSNGFAKISGGLNDSTANSTVYYVPQEKIVSIQIAK